MWIQSVNQACKMAVVQSEKGDCKGALRLLAEASSKISAMKITDEFTSSAYKEALQALGRCGAVQSEGSTEDTENTAIANETAAPSNKHTHQESAGDQCANEGEAWHESCPSALLEGKVTKQCKRGRIVTVTNTCKEAEFCGDHLSGTTWVEDGCPEGTIGSMKYRCNMGKKFRVYEDQYMCKETQCILPDGSTMAVGKKTSKQCGDVRRMFAGTRVYTGFTGDLGVAILSCQNVGSSAKILINGNSCTTANK